MWLFGDLDFPSVILVNKPMKALCQLHLLYLLSLWTYWHLKITQGPTRFSMEILKGVKWQTSRAAYNGPKQQWIVRKGTLYLIPAAASITMSRNQRVNLLFIICRFQSLNKKQIHGLLTRSQVGTCHPSRHMSPGTWHPPTDTWISPGVERLASESLHSIPEQNDAQNRTSDCIKGFFIFAIQMTWKTTGLGLLGFLSWCHSGGWFWEVNLLLVLRTNKRND